MPKRSLDIPTPADGRSYVPMPAKAQKTERSHEENQERAYIAASRRADRSLEARVQSARMASEIHRKRTGRGLKVTEEIVVKEEMYEEEEDDLPRFMNLGNRLSTSSSGLNRRASAYISTHAAMASMARYNEINKQFEQFFGGSAQPQLAHTPTSASDVASPTVSSGRPSISESRTNSGPQSPPALTPSGDASPETKDAPYNNAFSFSGSQLEPRHSGQSQVPSFFTSELSNNVKLMVDVGNSENDIPLFPMWQMSNQLGESDPYDLKKPMQLNTDQSNFYNDAISPISPSGLDNQEQAVFSPLDADVGLDLSQYAFPEEDWNSFLDFGSEQ